MSGAVTTFVVVGIAELAPPTGLDVAAGGGEAVHVAPPRDPESRGRILDCLEDAVATGGFAIVVHPDHLSALVLPMVLTARQLLGTHRVCAVALTVPPLAAAALVAVLPGIASVRPAGPGELAASIEAIAGRLAWCGWVRSVRHLTDRRGTWRQRWRSLLWMPRGFTLRGGTDAVDAAAAGRQEQLGAVHHAWVTGADRGRELLVGMLPVAARTSCTEAPPVPDGRRWFGCRQWAELVVLPDSVEALTRAAQERLVIADCNWCGADITSATCPFCGFTTVVLLDEPTRDRLVPSTELL